MPRINLATEVKMLLTSHDVAVWAKFLDSRDNFHYLFTYTFNLIKKINY